MLYTSIHLKHSTSRAIRILYYYYFFILQLDSLVCKIVSSSNFQSSYVVNIVNILENGFKNNFYFLQQWNSFNFRDFEVKTSNGINLCYNNTRLPSLKWGMHYKFIIDSFASLNSLKSKQTPLSFILCVWVSNHS